MEEGERVDFAAVFAEVAAQGCERCIKRGVVVRPQEIAEEQPAAEQHD